LKLRRRYSYLIEPGYDTRSFRELLDQVSQDNAPVNQTFKQDRVTSVWQLTFEQCAFMVKRYNTKNLWHAMRRSMRRSRAQNCWEMSRVFQDFGLTNPQRIACIQEWWGPFKLRSWFINRYINSISLLDYLNEEIPQNPAQELRIQSVYNDIHHLFATLKTNRLAHGDLKATNILLADKQLYLIDLDASQQYGSFMPGLARARRKDWRRFMKNWKDQPMVFKRFAEIRRELE